VINIGLGRQAT